jgi:uracil-DNA glycosylase family 4
MTELYSTMEYMDEIGFKDLLPQLPPKKFGLPATPPSGSSLSRQPPSNEALPTQQDPWPPKLKDSPDGLNLPTRADYSSRLTPDQILAQAGYGPQTTLSPLSPVNIGRLTCKEPPRLSSIDTSWIEGAQSLEELAKGLESCRNCLLFQSRLTVIPGRGPIGAPIFFIFDTPSQEMGKERRFPIGLEAELFDNIVTKGLKSTQDQIYVTALSKCPVPDPANYPETFPMKACSHIVFREIELVSPKVVVSLGARPSQILSGMVKSSFLFLKRQHLIIGRTKKIPLKVTFDLPTIIDNLDIKKEFWRDLKEVLAIL